MAKRVCIHCGMTLGKGCSCTFKSPKRADMMVEFCQQNTGTTIAELKRTICEYFDIDDRECIFKVTVYVLPKLPTKRRRVQ